MVLTHGWPDDVHCWDAVVGTLVEAGCRVYTPYLRGFGPTRFRRQETIRSGQIGALGRDLYDLLEGLDLHDVVLAGHDWGARASYVASVLVPERVRGLVALSVGYGSTSLDAPISFEQARAYWYQWFFATPKGRRTLEHDRPALCRHLWRLWAPSWKFTSEAFDEAASAWGIVLHGSDDGATLVTASEDKDQFFTAGYERRVLEGVGHFVPREAPSPAAKAILRLAT